jgi:hypothetical protein
MRIFSLFKQKITFLENSKKIIDIQFTLISKQKTTNK